MDERLTGKSAYAVVLAILALTTLLWFHATLLHPGTRLPGGFSDGTSAIRNAWAASVQHRNPFDITNDRLAGAPEGEKLEPALSLSNGAVQTAFVWGLKGPLGLVGAWNAFIVIGFIGTGLAMFALLDGLGCSFGASLFGAYLFAFNPYTLERTLAGHISFLQNWVFVGALALLIRLHSTRSPGAAVAVGGLLGFSFYLSAYNFLFAALMTGVFVLVELRRLPEARRRTLGLGAIAFIVSGLLLAPVFVLYFRESAAVHTAAAHAGSDFFYYSANLRSYFVPSPRNPFFRWVRDIHPKDLTEQTLYFGMTTWVLAIVAVVMVSRRRAWFRATDSRWWTSVYATTLVVVAFIMSLPPVEHIGSVTLPMPSLALALATSFWRVYSRFGLLVGLGLTVLASMALSALGERHGARWRLLAPAALIVVALFELFPGNVAAFNTTTRPPWVSWLAQAPRGIVATYPIPLGGASAFDLSNEDYWYQQFDGQPRFEFFDLGPLGNQGRLNSIRLLARNVTDPLTPGVLATEGVRYAVLHEDFYRRDGKVPPRPDPRHFTLVASFPNVRIYTVRAAHVNLDKALRTHRRELDKLEGVPVPARKKD